MRESRTYGSGRGACDETRVPTATQLSSCRVNPNRSPLPDSTGLAGLGSSQQTHDVSPSERLQLTLGLMADWNRTRRSTGRSAGTGPARHLAKRDNASRAI